MLVHSKFKQNLTLDTLHKTSKDHRALAPHAMICNLHNQKPGTE
ncbi:Protein of unknown function [Pyronema omphalodes CBS 100304]|uniref:Uncharacterized protein n=1 Tax=Pyronema omphalodes (strain CBS 100304) TaxID=1076935 RepID=U4KWF1_PYROM|nr:Protein of unknown function [Pyronema omphalodes CBS 100304]